MDAGKGHMEAFPLRKRGIWRLRHRRPLHRRHLRLRDRERRSALFVGLALMWRD